MNQAQSHHMKLEKTAAVRAEARRLYEARPTPVQLQVGLI
jgi:hypothetical protein